MVSPFMACEEAWLLIRFIREVAPEAALAMGPVPLEGEDQRFPVGASSGEAKFTILKEKCPNRRGIEMLLEAAGGTILTFEEFVKKSVDGEFRAGWIAGGYPREWVDKDTAKIADKFELLVVQDLFDSPLAAGAAVVLPAGPWAQREGSFVNAGGVVQPFERALNPPDGSRADGQYLFEVAGFAGLYRGERVREMMAESIPAFEDVYEAPAKPVHAH
jgi:NADH-quinone oxidoreductase subunit G